MGVAGEPQVLHFFARKIPVKPHGSASAYAETQLYVERVAKQANDTICYNNMFDSSRERPGEVGS